MQKLHVQAGFNTFPAGVKPKTGEAMMNELKKSFDDNKMGPINIISRVGGFFVHVVLSRRLRPSPPRVELEQQPAQSASVMCFSLRTQVDKASNGEDMTGEGSARVAAYDAAVECGPPPPPNLSLSRVCRRTLPQFGVP